jgi:hypothetical protein
VDSEVAKTLAELERKLQELERALAGAGSQDQRSQAPVYERSSEPAGTIGSSWAPDAGVASSGARLVDERLEDAVSAPPAPPAPGAAPLPPAAAQRFGDESIELAELARFRDRLEQTMRELLADYERVIRLRSISETRPPVDQT